MSKSLDTRDGYTSRIWIRHSKDGLDFLILFIFIFISFFQSTPCIVPFGVFESSYVAPCRCQLVMSLAK